MGRLFIILSIVAFFIFLALLLLGGIYFLAEGPVQEANNGPAILINYTNFEEELSKNSLVRALPEDSSILLNFYNFDSGNKEIEKTYLMKKSSVVSGTGNADIIMDIHSKYLKILTDQNFCTIVKTAKKNNDLSIDTSLSTTSLMWKFKSVMKYRDCLGF